MSSTSISETFEDSEFLIRAVQPPGMNPAHWVDGKLTSAALKDERGLSVDRTADRKKEAVVECMHKRFYKGHAIVSFSVPNCRTVGAVLCYLPSKKNKYHSEIHGNATEVVLSDKQALELAELAGIEIKAMPQIIG